MNWKIIIILGCICSSFTISAQHHSIARQWNEVLLEAIRRDFARPTVHARNLFHSSIAMYDAWAAYDEVAQTYFLGKTHRGFHTDFTKVLLTENIKAAREEAMSYAVYRLIKHRFQNAPNATESLAACNQLFESLGYDSTYTNSDYLDGPPAALGNYLAEQLIAFGLQDGSNEQNNYANNYYRPYNQAMVPGLPGNNSLRNPNRWQPLSFEIFIDQSGNPIPGLSLPFLGAEWGLVKPFALGQEELEIFERSGNEYWVYHNPPPPPYLDTENNNSTTAEYQWGFSLVSIWSAHLDPTDGIMWDISPASIGNLPDLPTSLEGLQSFYKQIEGGDPSQGHAVNPHTGMAYEPQVVPRGDYARVLAEFWADGPDSETPPGHWFSILNGVNDHPLLEKRFKGKGEIVDDLEWDVKAYFALGGAMHDAAVSAWSIKGWHDYIRPISAIRYMAKLGQCTDSLDLRYNVEGIPLTENYIELVRADDPLVGTNQQHLGKVKLRAWRGPDYIDDPNTDDAGVGWILAENWWPYQRPTFVTPPFAGYVSGHSTFSRAAAEVLTLFTGDAFFPGGMGEFEVKKNEFLVFEEGPSVDLTLQWATYRDASDQTSLSRIWGGIHPPADDVPGRLIGIKVGVDAFNLAEEYFTNQVTSVKYHEQKLQTAFLIKKGAGLTINFPQALSFDESRMYNINGQLLFQKERSKEAIGLAFRQIEVNTPGLPPGVYFLQLINQNRQVGMYRVVIQ